MKQEYKPYEDWWKRQLSIREFILSVTYDMGMFENNLAHLGSIKDIKSREEWMEYKK